MKKTLISILVLSAVVAFAASSPKVDRVPTIIATGDSNSVMRTAVVSESPTNEWAFLTKTLTIPSQSGTNLALGMTFVATPTVAAGFDSTGLNTPASGTIIATPTTTSLVVSNANMTTPTLKFLIYGIKRVGYSQP